ncbi:hypothetical protein LZP73_05405 [Shewanella sp. AS16]|uniref:hypothetical protein n=1 Tax=Shewanella sp. AS16 TaxID=2907625 RepID=UPI001F2F9F8C|nr:hypothetical protein [Shewanella sp. AS16]MCE9685652.1 hypothetical protein [Shewanella sp. AS16]
MAQIRDTDGHGSHPPVRAEPGTAGVRHPLHFCLTLLTFGLWGIVWWRLILRDEGKAASWFCGFDDAYWSYLIEREQPPAALHSLSIGAKASGRFSA